MYYDVIGCVSRVNELIDDIKAMHDKYSLIFSWICESKSIEMLNFKKITVAKTIQHNNAPIDKLRSIIIEYISFLSENTTKDFRLDEKYCDFNFRTRIKNKESIFHKLHAYTIGKEEGKIPLNKCLNDIYGMRIIVPNKENIIDNINIESRGHKIKCLDSSKNGYFAHHVYFYHNNFHFPWELQIWDAKDEINNIRIHQQYKQAYITKFNAYNESKLMWR